MDDNKKEKVPKIKLSRTQLLTDIGAELVSICSNITQDGSLNENEINQLKTWLDAHQNSSLPAMSYLTVAINRIISDGKISRDELTEMYKTIESILPSEIRSTLISQRKESEKRIKLEEKQNKLKNEPIASARFGCRSPI